MDGQVKLTPFKYAISRPAPLAFQQMLQKAEYEGVSKITEGKHFFKPIYRYNHNTYEEYCNMWDLEEYPVEMIKYLKQNNFLNILTGLEEAGKQANEILSTIERVKNGEEEFDFSKLMELFLQYKPYSIIIDDIKGVTTVCDVTTDIDPEVLERISKYQRLFDQVGVKLNLFLQEKLKEQFSEYGELAELLTIEEITGRKEISKKELQERKKGFYLHQGRIIKTEKMEHYKNENAINLPLKERGEQDKKTFKGVKRIDGTFKARKKPPVIIGQARLIYSVNDFMNMPSSSIVITPMIVREWEERLREDNIIGIVTDEPNENDFLREQRIDSIIGTEDATLYIENDDYVKMEGEIVRKLSKEEALEEYIKLLGSYNGKGYKQIEALINTTKSAEWNEQTTDAKIAIIKTQLEEIRRIETNQNEK